MSRALLTVDMMAKDARVWKINLVGRILKKLILHIGMPKTGSTSIQKSLQHYADGEIAYANLYKGANHGLAFRATFLEAEKELIFVKQGLSSEMIAARRDKYVAAIKRELARPEQTLIMSAEESNRFTPSMVQDFLDMVRPFERDVHIIGYVRDPVALGSSSIQEGVKNGSRLQGKCYTTRYRAALTPWLSAFDEDHITIALFDRKHLVGQDVVVDFATRVGIDPTGLTSKLANESIPDGVVRLLYDYYQKTPKYTGTRKLEKSRKKMVKVLRRNISGEKFRLPLACFDPVALSEDTRWLAQATGIDFHTSVEANRDKMHARNLELELSRVDAATQKACIKTLRTYGIPMSRTDSTADGLARLQAKIMNNNNKIQRPTGLAALKANLRGMLQI